MIDLVERRKLILEPESGERKKKCCVKIVATGT